MSQNASQLIQPGPPYGRRYWVTMGQLISCLRVSRNRQHIRDARRRKYEIAIARSTKTHRETKYTHIRVLKSHNSIVSIVERKADHTRFVCKVLLPSTHDRGPGLEIQIHSSLSHPSIVKCLDSWHGYEDTKIHRKVVRGYTGIMYLPFCNLGNLEGFSKAQFSRRYAYPEAFLWEIIRAILEALIYLQTGYPNMTEFFRARRCKRPTPGWKPVAHLDIHDRNILLTARRQQPGKRYPIVQLGDFGSAEMMDAAVARNPRHRYTDVKQLLAMVRQHAARGLEARQYSEPLRDFLEMSSGVPPSTDMARFDIWNVVYRYKKFSELARPEFEPLPLDRLPSSKID